MLRFPNLGCSDTVDIKPAQKYMYTVNAFWSLHNQMTTTGFEIGVQTGVICFNIQSMGTTSESLQYHAHGIWIKGSDPKWALSLSLESCDRHQEKNVYLKLLLSLQHVDVM